MNPQVVAQDQSRGYESVTAGKRAKRKQHSREIRAVGKIGRVGAEYQRLEQNQFKSQYVAKIRIQNHEKRGNETGPVFIEVCQDARNQPSKRSQRRAAEKGADQRKISGDPAGNGEEHGVKRRRGSEHPFAFVIDEASSFREVSGISVRNVRIVHLHPVITCDRRRRQQHHQDEDSRADQTIWYSSDSLFNPQRRQ